MSSPTNGVARSDGAESSAETTEEADVPTLSQDDAYHLLQNARRRAVLRYLFASDGEEFVMRDVAEAIAAWENDTTVQRLSSNERQRVYISLYQSHLPKLADHGVIEYNQSRGLIQLQPLAAVLEPIVGPELEDDGMIVVGEDEESERESRSAGSFISKVLR